MGQPMVDDNTVQHYVNSYLETHLPELVRKYQRDERDRIIQVEDEIRSQSRLLEKMLEQMDKRFEQVDKRFEQVDKRFEQVDKRFEQVDKRFEEQRESIAQRFEQVDKRFDHMFRFLTLGFVTLTVLMTLYQYL